jgi:hypothetical protein
MIPFEIVPGTYDVKDWTRDEDADRYRTTSYDILIRKEAKTARIRYNTNVAEVKLVAFKADRPSRSEATYTYEFDNGMRLTAPYKLNDIRRITIEMPAKPELSTMKALLGAMLDYKNYPNQMDESLHGSWANQNGPKVEDTTARAARSTVTEAKPVVAEQKVSLKSAADVKTFYQNKGFKHAPSDEYLKKYYEGYESKWVKNWAEVAKGLPEKYDITNTPPHVNGQYVAKELGIEVQVLQDETTKSLKKICSEGRLAIQLPSETLDKVLDDGRYKSQFETNSSMGMFDPDERAEAENAIFGYPTDPNEAPEDRPIYGFMAGKNSNEFPRISASYGDATIILKDEVKDRSTFTVGDSLDNTHMGKIPTTVPMPVNAPSHEACPLDYMAEDFPHQWEVQGAEYINTMQGAGRCGYIETQIHGGVRLGDIKEILFSGEPPKQIRDKLQANGIKYRVRSASEMDPREREAMKAKYEDMYKKMGR